MDVLLIVLLLFSSILPAETGDKEMEVFSVAGATDGGGGFYNTLSQFVMDKKIGRGQFSEVFRARCVSDGNVVALKKVQVGNSAGLSYRVKWSHFSMMLARLSVSRLEPMPMFHHCVSYMYAVFLLM